MNQFDRSSAAGTGRRRAACAALLIVSLTVLPDPAAPCTSSSPPPPFCGKSLVLAKAVPGVVLLPGGGTFTVPTLVFFTLVDFPPGSGICPPGPYMATVSLTATCAPPPGGGGAVTVPIVPGFNPIAVPVTVGAGPPRLCTITGTATTTLADGMTLTAAGDSVVCLAEPSPANPGLPRLDLQPLAPGSEIVAVHPGDQASYTYRITNNDPTESFSGVLTVEMVNSARLPSASGPMPPGTGVFSISDPGAGDNFPIAFAEDLFEGCIRLPSDPTSPEIPTLTQEIDLGPGQSIDVDVFARPWGMCANGSCGEAKLVLDGDFSDLTPGLACAGFVTAADTSVPPSYLWPDAGEVTRVPPPGLPNVTSLSGEPRPGAPRTLDFATAQAQLFVNGFPGPPGEAISDAVDPERGRTQVQFSDPLGFQVDSFFDIFVEIDVDPSPGQLIDVEIVQMELIAGAPTGFENVAPVGEALIELRPPGTFEVDSFFDITYQIQAVGIDFAGDRRDIVFEGVSMGRRPDGSGFGVQLAGGTVEPGASSRLQAIEIAQDFRGFTSETPQGQLGLIFADGFESGDVSAWSRSRP